ncbi:uncharacterized protein [Henckelia pumila]|uniref:uncharacterized protein n=1 Tax=Henckelia pumila TaxID=405737 RepID=UPI003C6DCAFA
MKHVMRKRFVPNHYYRDMYRHLHTLKHGSRSVEDYYNEMETTMIRTNIEEDNEATIARFLCGLNREIQDKLELRHCFDLDEMVQTDMKVEQQLKRRGVGRVLAGGRSSTSWRPNVVKREDNKPVSKPKSDTKLEAPMQEENGTPEASNTRSRYIKCFRCQGVGQIASQCPNKKFMIINACGDVESESDGGEDNYDDMPALEDLDDEGYGAVVSELLVTMRILNTHHKEEEEIQRENLFHTRCFVTEKVCSLIIDGGSCKNVSSCELVEKFGLPILKHPQPYRLQWFNYCAEVRVNKQVAALFSIENIDKKNEMALEKKSEKKRDEKKEFLLNTSDIAGDLPSIVTSLLQEFEDLFPEELPQGLPPLREIEHQINFVPGSALLNHPAYRSNSEETNKNLDDHVEHLRFVLITLKAENLYANLKKYVFCVGIGGVLMQGGKRVAYFSEKLNGSALNYPTYDKEFYALVRYKQGKENVAADALSRRYVLLTTSNSKFLGFEHVKELYASDVDFGEIYESCMRGPKDKYFMHDCYLFKEDRLCIPKTSIRELLVRESHSGGLMENFGVDKTYQTLHEHFYWPHMKHDVERVCEKCVTCRKAKYRTQPHGLYTPLPVPSEPWVDISIDFFLGLPRSKKVRENIERKNLQYTMQENKGRKKVVIEPGDWVWLQLRKKHFLEKRHSKLLPRGDIPFQVLERISDNAYKLDLPEGEDDAIMDGAHIGQVAKEAKDPLAMPQGPITRGRSKKFKESLQSFMKNYQDSIGVLEDPFGGCFNVLELIKDQENQENKINREEEEDASAPCSLRICTRDRAYAPHFAHLWK